MKKFTRGFNTTKVVEDNPFLSVACKSESLCDYGEPFLRLLMQSKIVIIFFSFL